MQEDAMPTAGPNEKVISFWQDVMVSKYLRFRSVLVGATALAVSHVHRMHPVPKRSRVLDVGCGFGETTIDWARRVGEDGEVVGLDPCAPFLDVARADARLAGVRNVSFQSGDAQTARLRGFDRVFSAFGVMFFAQPVAALRNLRAALNPGGRMQLLVWNTRADNPWLALAAEACDRVLPPVPEVAATCGPGPFSMSDPTMLSAMLERAGLAEIEIHEVRCTVSIGLDVERAIDFQLTLGPAGERMRLSGAQGTSLEDRIRDEVRRSLAPHRTEAGIRLASSVWYATGTG